MKRILACIILFFSGQLDLQAQYNIKNFGAKGDKATLDTRSIQSAIDKAAGNKGGVVEVPAGTYKIGTLILKDNVELHLQTGATLLGSPDIKDYQAVIQKFESRSKDLYGKYFMIFAEDAKNIAITGSGTIDGNGLKHFQEVKPQNMRPYMVRLVNCRNITIRDTYFMESANWSLHLLGCVDVRIDGIVIETHAEGNRDGLDIDACQRVSVSNSRFSTTDDAIVMKATTDVLCQDIAITNCHFRSGGSGVKTGTESNGGFKNITVSNCVMKDIDTHAGIELMTVDGGIMQNILLENITMENVATPFFIRLGIRARPYKDGQYVDRVDDVKDISINNVSAINAKLPSSIIGLHGKKMKNIAVTNYTVRYAETQDAIAYNHVPFLEFDYPAAVMFSKLPAYALYCRSVDGLYLNNINLYSLPNEKRPAVAMDRVTNAALFAVKASAKNQKAPMMHLRNSDNITASYCRTFDANDLLFESEEGTVNNLVLVNNQHTAEQKELVKVTPLPDLSIFEDFPTEIKFNVSNGEKYKGMTAHDLSEPLMAEMDITKRGALQLCLLVLNESEQPRKIKIKYEGITQEFTISWNEWGWAPISLLKSYPQSKKVRFEIVSSEPGNKLKIAKAYMRYQDIEFTD
ncbi:MAG: glycoside hydrolase family 28 protein [Bacteroidota bacterium]